ncbi:MAG: ion transporter [Pseudobdellovibrio sp.]
MSPIHTPNRDLKSRLHDIIFESDTPEGKAFDVALIVCIVLSVAIVMLESMPSVKLEYGRFLYGLEWFFTVLFFIEYSLRVYCIQKPMKYILSWYGVIDLLSFVPTVISPFIPGAQSLLLIRALRLLRIFRIFKLQWYFNEGVFLIDALKATRAKITVFLFTVVIIVTISGAIMYLVEGESSGFVSIPTSIYWAVVTLTTVGYGDISPRTGLGQFLASVLMILGYAIIAVPTGIVTSELTRGRQTKLTQIACAHCGAEGHDSNAKFCKFCGESLEV